jgi:hypothetical protein
MGKRGPRRDKQEIPREVAELVEEAMRAVAQDDFRDDFLDACEALRAARVLFDNGKRLESRIDALRAALGFLTSEGFPSALLEPLAEVLVHSMDEKRLAEHGSAPGPKPKTISDQAVWAYSLPR